MKHIVKSRYSLAFTEVFGNDMDTKQLLTLIWSMEGPDMIANFYPQDKRPIILFSFPLSHPRPREHPKNRGAQL